MSIEIIAGTLSDFFVSAKETAREIDNGNQLTPKNIIWVDPKDLILLLKPERTNLVKYLRKEKKVVFYELMQVLNRSSASLNNDLVRISTESKRGIHKVIESSFGNEKIEFRVEI
jgi:hypothetical protein